MVEPLAAAGVSSVAVELPSCGPSAPLGDLAGDAAAVRATLDAEPTILVGHSDGGVVITEAGAHPSVQRLVYVTSMLPDVGESLASLLNGNTCSRNARVRWWSCPAATTRSCRCRWS